MIAQSAAPFPMPLNEALSQNHVHIPSARMIGLTEKIYLNDLLYFEDVKSAKIRFNVRLGGTVDPVELFKDGDISSLLEGHYWNSEKKKSYSLGQTTIGFIRLQQEDLWLLFHVGKITHDLGVLGAVGYKHTVLTSYEKYFGRLFVRFKNRSTNLIRWAEPLLGQIEVVKLLDDVFDNDIFPGYENINISWKEMSRVIKKESWITALKNQKGVYLITDARAAKFYVGSAFGDNMLLSRWGAYVANGHGGNKQLKELDFDYIKSHFRYSVLDIYKSTTSKNTILEREEWWKTVLMTRKYGYNSNYCL